MATSCPVCKADVEEKKARGTTEHNGKTYYFCCKACKKKFDEAPEQYQTNK
jgi:YHS domain-containing protein